MPSSARPTLPIDTFAGSDKLRDLHEFVGRLVTSFGGVEDTLRYLDWQLQAFQHAARMPAGSSQDDLRTLLAPLREEYFGKHMVLSTILKAIDKGFRDAQIVQTLGTDAGSIGSEWQALRARALDVGNRRNAFAHSVVAISGSSPVRSAGLFKLAVPIDPATQKALGDDLVALWSDLGEFIEKLTTLLPFKDDNTIHFARAAVIL